MPGLDRAIGYETDHYDAHNGLISMDSTMRSNIRIDIMVVRRDSCNLEVNYRIEAG